jgi:hypothetical protein
MLMDIFCFVALVYLALAYVIRRVGRLVGWRPDPEEDEFTACALLGIQLFFGTVTLYLLWAWIGVVARR